MRFSLGILCYVCAIFLISPPVLSDEINLKSSIQKATKNFRDITVRTEITYKNEPALKKISDDFAKNMEFKNVLARFKAPDKLRLDGKIGVFKAFLIINGNTKIFRVPQVHYSTKENIKGKPHKRQTELDFGVLTKSLWNDYIVLEHHQEDNPNGEIYTITFARRNKHNKRFIAQVEPGTLKLISVKEFYDDGRLKYKAVYYGHKRINGIWAPNRVEYYNREGKLGAILAYKSISVNSGLPDSLFTP